MRGRSMVDLIAKKKNRSLFFRREKLSRNNNTFVVTFNKNETYDIFPLFHPEEGKKLPQLCLLKNLFVSIFILANIFSYFIFACVRF